MMSLARQVKKKGMQGVVSSRQQRAKDLNMCILEIKGIFFTADVL